MEKFKNALSSFNGEDFKNEDSYEYWDFFFSNKEDLQNIIFDKKYNCHTVSYFRDYFYVQPSLYLTTAVSRGDLFLVKYFCKRDFPKHESACEFAANYGQLECLKYLHENGYPWDEQTCNLAAKEGHFYCYECLKYAVENGCPYNYEELLVYADYQENKECLEYLVFLEK